MHAKRWIICFFLWATPAFAFSVESPLTDAAQEARAKTLFHQIRCAVCQSETIADSPALIARDMRRLVREKIAAGESDAAISAYLIAHYGDGIMMKPPFNAATMALWIGPWCMLIAGLFALRRLFRRSPSRGLHD